MVARMDFGNLQYDFSIDKTGEITYHTPITQDVIGHLSWTNVEKILEEIFKL